MKFKKILVLGATGFIGKNITLYFSKKKKIILSATYHKKKPFECNNVKWIKADLTDKTSVKSLFENVDVVIQAAATTSGAKDIIERPYIHISDNAIMNSLILKEIYHSNVKHFIFFSCIMMYPNSSKRVKENKKIEKINPKYFGSAYTKLYIEKMCEFYSKISNKKFTIIRHSNVYGPHDKYDLERSHFFGATITKVLNALNKNLNSIEVWGDGKEKRDLLYIDDLINFIFKVLSKQKSLFEIFNCGYEKSLSVDNVVRKIIKKSHPNCRIKFNQSKPSIKTNVVLDCKKAKDLIDWSATTSIDTGIDKTIKWWKNNVNQKSI